ncbi:MAG: hypothetical protein ACEY26_00460 [Candidatus Hodgkinia cicadicola]
MNAVGGYSKEGIARKVELGRFVWSLNEGQTCEHARARAIKPRERGGLRERETTFRRVTFCVGYEVSFRTKLENESCFPLLTLNFRLRLPHGSKR